MALTQPDRTWIEEHFTSLRELITANRIDIAVLKTKAGIWGLMGGLIPALIIIGYLVLRGGN